MADSLSYDTAMLVEVVPNLKLSQNFLLDTFFPGVVTFDTEEVAIDIDVGKRRMAPFVSPLVEGKLVEQRRLETNRFKPAYIKDKRAPDLRKPIRRMIGERIGGGVSAYERMMFNLNAEMEDQVDMVRRRLEWMASSALVYGQITIAGDGFPTSVINFGRSSSQTITKTSQNYWGTAGNYNPDGRDPVPTADINAYQALILQASGAVVTDIVFTNGPWNAFLNAEGVQGAILYPSLATSGNNINPGPQITKGAVYKGRWGQYNLWLYNDWYVDDNNVEQPLIPAGYIVMCGEQMMGTQAYGLIVDPEFDYQPLQFAPKTWVQPDPAQRLIMMQSAPVVIPSRVNACLSAKVTAS